MLTIFYDGNCPLCMTEMRQLKNHDTNKNINFVNLHIENFTAYYPDINPIKAYGILHGKLDTGEILLGLDVTCTAWKLVGKHRWLAILRWPIIRAIADIVYFLFARYRNTISYLLTGKKPCSSCSLN